MVWMHRVKPYYIEKNAHLYPDINTAEGVSKLGGIIYQMLHVAGGVPDPGNPQRHDIRATLAAKQMLRMFFLVVQKFWFLLHQWSELKCWFAEILQAQALSQEMGVTAGWDTHIYSGAHTQITFPLLPLLVCTGLKKEDHFIISSSALHLGLLGSDWNCIWNRNVIATVIASVCVQTGLWSARFPWVCWFFRGRCVTAVSASAPPVCQTRCLSAAEPSGDICAAAGVSSITYTPLCSCEDTTVWASWLFCSHSYLHRKHWNVGCTFLEVWQLLYYFKRKRKRH